MHACDAGLSIIDIIDISLQGFRRISGNKPRIHCTSLIPPLFCAGHRPVQVHLPEELRRVAGRLGGGQGRVGRSDRRQLRQWRRRYLLASGAGVRAHRLLRAAPPRGQDYFVSFMTCRGVYVSVH